MSKRKAPAAADGADGAPPRLGDHASYMPEPMLPLADVRIKVLGGAVLPAHASALVLNCGALARSSELLADATSKAPVVLSSPFDEYEEAGVARFLACLYTGANTSVRGEDAAEPAVLRLAHALDAAPVLDAARQHIGAKLGPGTPLEQLCATAETAVMCGWSDISAAVDLVLHLGLQTPLSASATKLQVALSDAEAFRFARAVIEKCPIELAARAFGTLAANFRRLHPRATAAARASSMDPDAKSAAIALAAGAAFEVDGRFVAFLDVPDFTDERPVLAAAFKSHGLEWKLKLYPNGKCDYTAGCPYLGIQLMHGWPKKVRYQAGLAMQSLALESRADEVVFTERSNVWYFPLSLGMTLPQFRDLATRLVACQRVAIFAHILEVSDPTPEEAPM